MSTTFNVISGIVLCSAVTHVLSLYIEWVPDFDIWIFLIICALNLTQCLPNPDTPR